MTTVGGQAYQWDDNGNLINDGTTTYQYNTANRLTSLTKGAESIVYKYSGLPFLGAERRDRLQQIVNGTSTNYTLDITSGLTQALDDGTNKYLYGNGRIAQVAATQPLQGASRTGYFLPDALGSVRQMADAAGTLNLAKNYDPYGNVVSSSGIGDSLYGYTGETQLEGLVYLRSRYLNSNDGRFINKDSFNGFDTDPVSQNPYVYGYANPIANTDHTGKNPILECLLLMAATAEGPVETIGITGCVALLAGTTILTYGGLVTLQKLEKETEIGCPPVINSWEDILKLDEQESKISPNPTPERQPIPVAPSPKIPTQTETPKPNNWVITYSELNGDKSSDNTYYKKPQTNPGSFRMDEDGVSTFEMPDLPGIKPYALGFKVKVNDEHITQGATGVLEDLPICTATFTPQFAQGKRHWSINCVTAPTNIILSEYAKGIGKDNIILNPAWKSEPQDRKLP
jgi:RHS repeat-associated protein